MSRELYQKIYRTRYRHYGEMAFNHCPGIRLLPHYKEYLKGKIIDLGCGTGETVQYLREYESMEADGIDWISMDNGMIVGNILSDEASDIMVRGFYKTCLCMDVLEHIPAEDLGTIFSRMAQTERQIFSISNTPSWVEMDGKKINCHVTDNPFPWWNKLIQERFKIIERKQIRDMQMLYITENKE